MTSSVLRFTILLLVLFVIAAPARQAQAAELTAARLNQLCLSKVEIEEIACRYFLYGIFQGLSFGDSTAKGPDNKMMDRPRSHFCPPDNVSADQLIKVYTDAARTLTAIAPDDMQEAALGIVDAAFGHAFPCKLK